MEEDRMLIVFGGLPGTGKTTIARPLAAQLGAMYLRIDIIEQAIRNADVLGCDVGTAGYGVANAEPHLVIDTAAIDAKGAVDLLLRQLHTGRGGLQHKRSLRSLHPSAEAEWATRRPEDA